MSAPVGAPWTETTMPLVISSGLDCKPSKQKPALGRSVQRTRL